MTTLVHGADETAKAIAASHALFGQGDLAGLDEKTLAAALAEVPSATVRVPGGTGAGQLPPVADLMAEATLVPSKSAGRRAIAEGGAYLNNRKITEPDARPALRTCCTAGSWCSAGASARLRRPDRAGLTRPYAFRGRLRADSGRAAFLVAASMTSRGQHDYERSPDPQELPR